MTLAEIAELATTKLHRTDAESVAEAKVYARIRYNMVWNSRLWRDTQGLLATSLAATQTVILPALVDRVIACRWDSMMVLQYEQPITILHIDPTVFDADSDPVSFSLIAPSGVLVSPAGSKVAITSSSTAASCTVGIRGVYLGSEVYETLTLSGVSSIQSVNNYDEILHLSKNSDVYDMTVKTSDLVTTLLFLPSPETSRKHQRLHFHSTPTQSSSTALVLYKRRCNDLIQDSDSTEISGIDPGLVALVEADMLEGQRQYAKAQAKMAEGGVLIQAAADMEQHQSANMVRIIPEVYEQEWVDQDWIF